MLRLTATDIIDTFMTQWESDFPKLARNPAACLLAHDFARDFAVAVLEQPADFGITATFTYEPADMITPLFARAA